MEVDKFGIAGEFRIVHKDYKDNIILDTGFQRNLILDQGLEFFGGNYGGAINASCVIGSGNSSPEKTQTKLDSFLAIKGSSGTQSQYSYVDKGDGLYRMWEEKKYRFEGLSDVNISEVGLVSSGSSSSNYYLTTRSLIKDSLGKPTSISIREGETLDLYYKIHKVIDISEKSYVVNLVDGDGIDSIPYNVVIKPQRVGSSQYHRVSSTSSVPSTGIKYSKEELGDFTSEPSSGTLVEGVFKASPYVPLSNKREIVFDFGLTVANSEIRTLFGFYRAKVPYYSEVLPYYFLPFQVRFGSVDGDLPIGKTEKHTLRIPLEVSWGRFEGEL